MAHLNCFPPRATGVNFWFFIAVPSSGGCWYKTKCEMLLRKIDGEMNVQNCGFSAKLWNRDSGDMLHDWWQWQLSRTRTVIFQRDDILPLSKTSPAINRNGWSKFCNLHLFTFTRSQLMLCGWQRLLKVAQTARSRRQKHRRRRPSDDQNRSKFGNY